MNDSVVKLNTAILAKEKNFDVEVNSKYYSCGKARFDILTYNYKKNWNGLRISHQKYYSAPEQSILQKWLREVHNLHIVIKIISHHGYYTNICDLNSFKKEGFIKEEYIYESSEKLKTYEEALEEGLQEALKLITNERTNNFS